MKTFMFLVLANIALAQDASKPLAPPSNANNAPILSMDTHNKGVIVIDAKARAADCAQVFDSLRKDKPTLKVMVRTADMTYMGVADVTAANGGTLLMLKIPSSQGTKLQIVPVDQIVEINYST